MSRHDQDFLTNHRNNIFLSFEIKGGLGAKFTPCNIHTPLLTLSHALATLLMEIKCMWKPQSRDRTKYHKREITTWPPTSAVEDPAWCQQKQTNKAKQT
jgi:hypothetical protein